MTDSFLKLWVRRLSALQALALVLILARPDQSWAASCDGSDEDFPRNLTQAIEYLQSGNFDDFVSIIDPEGALSIAKRSNLSSGLRDISEFGFTACSIIIKREEERSIQTVVLLRHSDRHLIAYFFLGNIGNEWLFLKAQISTDFDEIIALVR